MTKKIQKTVGNIDKRYFWNVGAKGEDTGIYRSRHATARGVVSEFARNGKTVMSIRPTLA